MLNLRPIWGIDIGDAAIKAVKLKQIGKQVVVQDFHVFRYAELAGEVGARREGNLSQALVALQQTGLGKERCCVSIAPQAIFSRFISLPPVDKRRVPEIVLYEARQQIPFSLNEVIWAYQTVRKEFIPGEEIEIGLFAAKRDMIDAYIGELSTIGRQLHGIQVAPLALYNFIRHDIALEQPTVVMDIGAQSTDLLIIDGDKFWLRNLPIAGNSFTAVLEKRLNIPRAEAEKLKLAVPESRHRRKLLEVLRPIMRDMVGEVQRSIGYYKSLAHDVKFEDILVLGDGYRLFGLDRFLTERLQYNVRPLQGLNNIVYQAAPERLQEFNENMGSLGVAMGLALQGLGRGTVSVDLLPDDFVIDRELHRKRFSGLVAAGLVCAIVGLLFMDKKAELKRIEDLGNKGETTLGVVDKKKKEFDRVARFSGEDKLKTYPGFGKHALYDVRLIGAMAGVIPKGIRIDKFVFSRETVALRATDGPPGTSPRPSDRRPGSRTQTQTQTKGRLLLEYKAWCPAPKEAPELKERLPSFIKTAAVYPEQVEIVPQDAPDEGVAVGEIRRTKVARVFDGNDGEPELTAPIRITLRGAQEAAKLREQKVEKLKQKHDAGNAASVGEARVTNEAGKAG